MFLIVLFSVLLLMTRMLFDKIKVHVLQTCFFISDCTNSFACKNGKATIPIIDKCNGDEDCDDGSDEEGCGKKRRC